MAKFGYTPAQREEFARLNKLLSAHNISRQEYDEQIRKVKEDTDDHASKSVDVRSEFLSTVATIPGYQIMAFVGPVFGEVVFGANALKDLASVGTDIFGGRSESYESEFRKARDQALRTVVIEMRKIGGNAVVGLRLDYHTIRGGMMMVAASGTAVLVRQPNS